MIHGKRTGVAGQCSKTFERSWSCLQKSWRSDWCQDRGNDNKRPPYKSCFLFNCSYSTTNWFALHRKKCSMFISNTPLMGQKPFSSLPMLMTFFQLFASSRTHCWTLFLLHSTASFALAQVPLSTPLVFFGLRPVKLTASKQAIFVSDQFCNNIIMI